MRVIRGFSILKSLLIRYIKSSHAESYLKGEIYMSSVSYFWSLEKAYQEMHNPETKRFDIYGQQDFSEGLGYAIPKNKSDLIIESEVFDYQNISDYFRLRVEAYKYTNISCFYRVDISSPKDFLNCYNVLNNQNVDCIKFPGYEMDVFGDKVLIIKDEEEFIKRIKKAVKKEHAYVVMGDVRYYDNFPGLTVINEREDGKLDNLNSFIKNKSNIKSYGLLDKRMNYQDQNEWRICYLGNKDGLDTEPKILKVGNLIDIIDIVDTKNFRQYIKMMLELNKFNFSNNGKQVDGNISYENFKNKVANIDKEVRKIVSIDPR